MVIWVYVKIVIVTFQCGDRLYTSDSDVCRRQILTYKYSPRAERVKPVLAFVSIRYNLGSEPPQ